MIGRHFGFIQASSWLGEGHQIREVLYACMLSGSVHVRLFQAPGAVAHQAFLFMGFSRQEY